MEAGRLWTKAHCVDCHSPICRLYELDTIPAMLGVLRSVGLGAIEDTERDDDGRQSSDLHQKR